MLPKIWAIAWNSLYRTFTDRVAFMFMFLAPLGISAVMGLAFGGQSGDLNLPESKIIVVNLDTGTQLMEGQEVNLGETYLDVLVNDVSKELDELIEGEIGNDAEKARQKVKDGDVRATFIIPPDFSASVNADDTQGTVELYYNPGSDVEATILISVVEQITATLNTGQVAQDIFIGVPDGYFLALSQNPAEIAEAAQNVLPAIYTENTARMIDVEAVNVEGDLDDFNALAYFAPGMAVLFMTYAMAGGTRGILEDQRSWTMQRILTTPTPRWVYMAGKLFGTYLTGLVQMTILLFVTPLVAVMTGGSADIWGDNYAGIFLVTITVVFAGTGIGLLIAGASKTVQQADTLSNAILFLMAMLGGSFIQVEGIPVVREISRLTLNYWGLNGYFDLSTSNATVGDILPNAAILTLMGVIFFATALWQFNKRIDV